MNHNISLFSFNENRAVVVIEKDKKDYNAIIDKSGKIIWGPSPAFIESSYSEGLVRFGIEKDDWSFPQEWLFGFLDSTAMWLLSHNIQDASDFHDGIAAVSQYDGPDTYIDKKGKEILKNVQKELAGGFTEGLGAI